MDTKTRTLANMSDLDAWIEKAEDMGQLKRITAEVDPNLETSTITYMVGREPGSPALLFENIKGHPGHKAIYNLIGCNLDRFCLSIGEAPVDHPLDAAQILKEKMHLKTNPKEVSIEDVLANQNVETGDNIDITKFPAPRMWPLDGGKYLGTNTAVITRDPESDRINVGTYRQMIKARDEIGLYTSPGKDAGLDRDKWWAKGKPMPVALCYGIDPLLFVVAATSFAKTESEYEYYGGIKGEPLEVFTGDITGLPLPARAEIILEGHCYPDNTFAEGPFGEFTGYYGRPSGETPYVKIEKVRYRDNPTLTCALMADGAANEAGLFGPCCAPLRCGTISTKWVCRASKGAGPFPKPPAGASPWFPSSRCMPVTRPKPWRWRGNAWVAPILVNISSSSIMILIPPTSTKSSGLWQRGPGLRHRSIS